MNWYVIYTKSRAEKLVAEKLSAAGIQVYCPLLRKKKQWSDRWKWVEEPLFRSYCFVRLDELHKDDVFRVSGVVRYVQHCGKPAIVRDKEIETLQHWLSEFDNDSIYSGSLEISDRIVIKSGLLIDKKAEIVEKNANFATLYLEDLGLKVRVDLRRNIVEKLASY